MPATPLGGRRERAPRREACLLRGNAASENTTVLGLPLHWFPKTERARGMRGTIRTGRCRETTLVRPQPGKSRPRGRRGPESGSREAGWAGPGRVSVGLGLALSRTGSSPSALTWDNSASGAGEKVVGSGWRPVPQQGREQLLSLGCFSHLPSGWLPEADSVGHAPRTPPMALFSPHLLTWWFMSTEHLPVHWGPLEDKATGAPGGRGRCINSLWVSASGVTRLPLGDR